ncbi:hypothetical protein ZWY2020_049689 [Hordeum vulgare]|nr:hypothetical protein ZWY2020_049689 [Hordeum vulgare]
MESSSTVASAAQHAEGGVAEGEYEERRRVTPPYSLHPQSGRRRHPPSPPATTPPPHRLHLHLPGQGSLVRPVTVPVGPRCGVVRTTITTTTSRQPPCHGGVGGSRRQQQDHHLHLQTKQQPAFATAESQGLKRDVKSRQRWGYHNLSVVEDVVENYRSAQIPLDVIWNYDDHMDARKDFTLSPMNYPRPKLLAFLDMLQFLEAQV